MLQQLQCDGFTSGDISEKSVASIARSVMGLMAFLAGANIDFAQTAPHFPPPLSPGEAIKRATQAAAVARGRTGPIDILSDTQGTDFGPYLQAAMAKVRQNWYNLIPESAEMENGKLAIE